MCLSPSRYSRDALVSVSTLAAHSMSQAESAPDALLPTCLPACKGSKGGLHVNGHHPRCPNCASEETVSAELTAAAVDAAGGAVEVPAPPTGELDIALPVDGPRPDMLPRLNPKEWRPCKQDIRKHVRRHRDSEGERVARDARLSEEIGRVLSHLPVTSR